MKVNRKYTAMQISTQKVDNTLKIGLEYGDIKGSYYSQIYPEVEFDTEEEAIKWAYEHDKYITWMIVPIVTFED